MKYQKWAAKDGQIYVNETGKTIALIPHFDNEFDQIQNSRLMASAPDLLDIVEKAYNEGWLNNNLSYKRMAENILNEFN